MNENERDKWDDAIRSRLKDFEADTTPADWEAIADRLPGKAPVPLRRTRRYWTVAAAIAALSLLSGGIYFYERKAGEAIPALASIPAGQTADEGKLAEEPARRPAERTPLLATAGERGVKGISVARAPRALARVSRGVSPDRGVTMRAAVLAEGRDTSLVAGNRQAAEASPASADRKESAATRGRALIAEAAPVSSAENVSGKKRGKVRKWGFGMGGGGFSVGADNMVPRYVTNSDALRSENLMALNALDAAMAPPAETDIRHRTPIGFGLSVSRYLNDRFSLQTGVTYSYLRSEWSTNNTYHVDNDQRLHFIGIPLSLTYKIAEWNRFQFYASAGGMTEVNVAGKRKMKLFSDDVEILAQSERVRMKEWLWSVNARMGVSYPIIRFVSAFGEVGASYYFDNGSDIETIHSEKPFNVSLQFGFRFGF